MTGSSGPSQPISYAPTVGLSYSPDDPKYWDPEMLKLEVTRAFELCHGCRMCFKYCDSFPSLFKLLDEKYDGDVHQLTAAETDQVMDNCFQCKLCEVQCPYTPRDKHEYQLDFPKLVHRYQAQRTRKNGIQLRERLLGDPDKAGQMARASFGLANKMNRVKFHRFFFEKIVGVHREKNLPDFASETFDRWAEGQGLTTVSPASKPEAVLFQTCYVQNNEPEIGKDAIEVLKASEVKTACVKGLHCCGMPKWEHGDLEGLRKQAKANLDLLIPYVKEGAKVLAINPTCAMMMRREYPELVDKSDRERALQLAAAVKDPCEHLWGIRNEPRFNQKFESSPGPISYHAPCHLRAQAIGFKGRDLMKRIPGVEIHSVTECCGHDGTFAMKVESYEASKRIGQKAFDGMNQNSSARVWSTECPLAATQFEQHAGTKPLHPISILARSYRKDGFKDVLK